jgi:chemotaxis protein histidine kinase CheA
MNETQTSSATTAEEQNIKSLWTALRVAEGQLEKRGLPFGQALYEYREKHSAQGRRTDLNIVLNETRFETFEEFCDRLSIVRSTAYRWIAKYEESIGTRLLKSDSDKCPSENEVEPIAQRGTASKDVSPSDDSFVDDPALLESEPTTSPAPTSTPVVTTEEKDRKQLRFLAHRLDSLSIALQQVVDKKAKLSRCKDEYADVVFRGEKIADLVKLM